MYTLESIQTFDSKRIGIYTFGKESNRKTRKALKLLVDSDEIPIYAILTVQSRITKGIHKLFINNSSFVKKVDEYDGTEFDSYITI